MSDLGDRDLLLPFQRRCQASEPQKLDVVARGPVERELGDDLADDRAELEAVARETGGDDGGCALRMQVDEEMLVGAMDGDAVRLEQLSHGGDRREPEQLQRLVLGRGERKLDIAEPARRQIRGRQESELLRR